MVEEIWKSYALMCRQKLFEAIVSELVYNQGINCSQSHLPKVCKVTKNILDHYT